MSDPEEAWERVRSALAAMAADVRDRPPEQQMMNLEGMRREVALVLGVEADEEVDMFVLNVVLIARRMACSGQAQIAADAIAFTDGLRLGAKLGLARALEQQIG